MERFMSKIRNKEGFVVFTSIIAGSLLVNAIITIINIL